MSVAMECQPRSRRQKPQCGAVTLEFMLLAPMVLAMLLVILQTALLLQGWIVVHQAALAAVRSAVVAVPASMRDAASGETEGVNEIRDTVGSPKHRFVRKAAALVLATVSPPWTLTIASSTGTGLNLDQAASVATVSLLFPAESRAGAAGFQLAQRLPYAANPSITAVQVSVEKPSDTQPTAGTVRVRLTYRFFLGIPFADRLFGKEFGGSFFGPSARYRELSAEYVLPVDLNPIFPKQPRPGVYFEQETLE